MPTNKIRVLVQVGHESPRQPRLEANTGSPGEVEVVRKIGAALTARLESDRRFRPRLIPGKVPSDVADGSFPVDAFIALHCDGAANKSAEGWSLGFPDDPINKKLADAIATEFKKFHRSAQRGDNNTVDMHKYYAYKLVPTPGPEVLVEHGFVSNPVEHEWLNDHIAQLAEAEYQGLLAHFGLENLDGEPIPAPHPAAPVPLIGRVTVVEAVTPSSTILGAPRTTRQQIRVALLGRDHHDYTDRQVRKIGNLYVDVATSVGIDPLVAVAQMVLETGNLTSFWSQPPRRNPAGIGVTGEKGVGLSFKSWRQAVRAHVGRLLAYAVPAGQETPAQRELVDMALDVRPLPDQKRGIAPTLQGLAGSWAADPEYADKLARVAAGIVQA
jgi:hypothetical protein